ncbi:hypothetical protein B0H66DRAFT_550922 [Apodospora peruviana]|uniref:Uncharacterized protein n=1 Tax=Apodospora peruviana TaxID=516989 RepID=A0AAE0MBG3_9PEZI|nr:hypothetical protein B0H66DRAFT_550922 [Apodospora peruviana]
MAGDDNDNDVSNLLTIGFGGSDDDSEPEEAANPNTTTSNSTTSNGNSRSDRNALSETNFQLLKQNYMPKIENGKIHKSIQLPLSSISKPDAQQLLHAVEELYFYRRYDEAVDFVRKVFSGPEVNLDQETKRLLGYYEKRCSQRTADLQTVERT